MPHKLTPPPVKSEAHDKLVRFISDSLERCHAVKSLKEREWRNVEEQMWLVKQGVQEVASRIKRESQKPINEKELAERIHVPVVYTLNMALISPMYDAVVRRDPPLPLKGVSPDDSDPALLNEALLAQQAAQRRLAVTQYKALYSGITYNCGIIKTHWTDESQEVGVDYSEDFDETGDLIEVPLDGYKGNTWEYVSPYDFFHDPSVPVRDIQAGQWVCQRDIIHERDLRDLGKAGIYFNVEEAIEGSEFNRQYQTEGASRLFKNISENPDTGGRFTGETGKHDIFWRWEFIGRITPADFQLTKSQKTQKWLFTMVNGVIVRAEPWTYKHGHFPYATWEPHPLLQLTYGPSYVELQSGLSKAIDWSLNFRVDSGRRSVNTWLFIDTDCVEDMSAFESNNPLKFIPSRTFGQKALSDIVYQVPFHDSSGGAVSDMNMMWDILQRMFAVSEGSQGQFASGRRTAQEASIVQTGVSVRGGLLSDLYVQMMLSELTLQSVGNNQQFMSENQYVRIFGDKYLSMLERLKQAGYSISGSGPYLVNVSRNSIAGNFDYQADINDFNSSTAARLQFLNQLLVTALQANPAIMQMEGRAIKISDLLGQIAESGGIKDFRQRYVQNLAPSLAAPPPSGLGANGAPAINPATGEFQ